MGLPESKKSAPTPRCPRTAALRFSKLGAGVARLPKWGRRTFPKPHPYLDSSRCFVSNQPVVRSVSTYRKHVGIGSIQKVIQGRKQVGK